MHFRDAYNYDIERVKLCLIHYATPDGKLYPFCRYNSGSCYREKIERPDDTAANCDRGVSITTEAQRIHCQDLASTAGAASY